MIFIFTMILKTKMKNCIKTKSENGELKKDNSELAKMCHEQKNFILAVIDYIKSIRDQNQKKD